MEYLMNPPPENLWCEQVTIKSGASTSEIIYTQGHAMVGIQMPAAWTAAQIGFDVSIDGANFNTAYDGAGNLEQAKGTAAAFIPFPTSDAIKAPFIRLKSVDASNVAVNQGADRAFSLMFQRFLGGS